MAFLGYQTVTELLQRLKKNYLQRQKLIETWPTNAFRLYDRDLPNYPFIVDCYKDHAIIWFKGKKRYADDDIKEQELLSILNDLFDFPAHHIHLKKRSPQKRFERYQKLEEKNQNFKIQEGPYYFEINPTDYLDVGLFLDHRPLRREVFQAIEKHAQPSPQFLNLFCYTGSVSVAAAMAGAHTTNIDLSQTYLDWAKRNFQHNNIPMTNQLFLQQSATDLAGLSNKKFDLVYIDPPTFSNSKKTQDFELQIHHEKLLLDLQKLCHPETQIIFSCNKRDFELSPQVSQVFSVQNRTSSSIPSDFRDQGIHHRFHLQLK
jgi:23S rRNA (cytosine1962-C5)-methyltransferase